MIRQQFIMYCCESDMPVNELGITLNYVHSPFNKLRNRVICSLSFYFIFLFFFCLFTFFFVFRAQLTKAELEEKNMGEEKKRDLGIFLIKFLFINFYFIFFFIFYVLFNLFTFTTQSSKSESSV